MQQSGLLRELKFSMARWFLEGRCRSEIAPRPQAQLHRAGLLNLPFIILPASPHEQRHEALVRSAWPLLLERCPDLRLIIPLAGRHHYAAVANSCAQSVVIADCGEDSLHSALYDSAQAVWIPAGSQQLNHGAPVVASRLAAAKQHAEDSALFVPADQPAAHAAALSELVLSAGTQRKYRDRGRSVPQPGSFGAPVLSPVPLTR